MTFDAAAVTAIRGNLVEPVALTNRQHILTARVSAFYGCPASRLCCGIAGAHRSTGQSKSLF
ncbi:hypothetical protein [Hoeflea poritis]|uniref:Uncharacterized protein n=1 Tax=Hoeflea poritis TaxID=2993659 RepID=A0ABT4VR29_9HYPH|nr:hypothetical protein [Hoeflea poritis]MDA4847172.1 hypothetical protein [Hoeflea poritis]